MITNQKKDFLIGFHDPIVITGASGFIGRRLVQSLLDLGFRNLRCFVRPWSDVSRVPVLSGAAQDAGHVQVVRGNLLAPEDCAVAADAAVVFHLAAARGEKSFADAFMNSVVTTRNLLEACLGNRGLRRFVNVSSFTVYTNKRNPRGRPLAETSPVETHPELRGDPYCFAKVKQEQIVTEYGKQHGIPYVIVRPGHVYGAGNEAITGRVGISTFGMFLHLGGSNTIPLTYVENCADAIALAGVTKGVAGEVFNVVDDDLPSSRQFLRQYKRSVGPFHSLWVPPAVSYALCYLWERYAAWSEGQLPPLFNRRRWYANWNKARYSNEKLKSLVGWAPKVPTAEGLMRYFDSCSELRRHA
ncbi:MAG: NAD(P)-dependent oxidoreductase [Acidobacteriia bacterium]|nr:NAD(P)-dependent oxidoreductase [Terriglobia bacterium]